MVNVGPCPSVNGLIVVTGAVHAFGLAVEDVCDIPLQGGQVLCFVEEGQLKRWAAHVGLRNELGQHVGEIVHAEFLFIRGQSFIDVFNKVPIQIQVAVVVLVAQRSFLEPG